MVRILPLVALFLLGSAGPALAQQPGGKPKAPPSAGKAKAGKSSADNAKADQAKVAAPKDDPVTAKDPVVVALDQFAKKHASTKAADWRTRLPAPPVQKFAAGRDYLWHVETSCGLVVVRLFGDSAPAHATSTVYLARLGFYDGLAFHRVLKGFMAQGGCPRGDGTGNAGYTLDGEFGTPRPHDKPGLLSAANAARPNTDGSQFFLTFVPTPHLDGKHTVYGEVVQGLDVLPKLEALGTAKDGETMAAPPSIVRSWVRVVVAKPGDGAGQPGKPGQP